MHNKYKFYRFTLFTLFFITKIQQKSNANNSFKEIAPVKSIDLWPDPSFTVNKINDKSVCIVYTFV